MISAYVYRKMKSNLKPMSISAAPQVAFQVLSRFAIRTFIALLTIAPHYSRDSRFDQLWHRSFESCRQPRRQPLKRLLQYRPGPAHDIEQSVRGPYWAEPAQAAEESGERHVPARRSKPAAQSGRGRSARSDVKAGRLPRPEAAPWPEGAPGAGLGSGQRAPKIQRGPQRRPSRDKTKRPGRCEITPPRRAARPGEPAAGKRGPPAGPSWGPAPRRRPPPFQERRAGRADLRPLRDLPGGIRPYPLADTVPLRWL